MPTEGFLPAPDTPVTETMEISGVMSFDVKAGSTASVAPVGKHPGTAMRRVLAIFSLCPGISGIPYGHEPA